MDDVVAERADHEGLASFTRHELCPWRLWLPRFAEVGELADVVDFDLAGVLAHLASSCLEPLDQLGVADDDAWGWCAVGEDRFRCRVRGMPPKVAVNGFLPVRVTVTCRHLRGPCGVSMVVL
jgi:hypothetical protein